MEAKKVSWRKCLLLLWREGSVSMTKYLTDLSNTPYDDSAHLMQEKGLRAALESVFAATPNGIDDIGLPILDKVITQLLEEKE